MAANPLNLSTTYVWQPGDTLALVALKYRRPGEHEALIPLNQSQLYHRRYKLEPGDQINIPTYWLPLKEPPSFSTKFTGSKGERIP